MNEVVWSDPLTGPGTSCRACRWHIHIVDEDGVDPWPTDGCASYEIAKSLGDEHYPSGYVIRPVTGRVATAEAREALLADAEEPA